MRVKNVPYLFDVRTNSPIYIPLSFNFLKNLTKVIEPKIKRSQLAMKHTRRSLAFSWIFFLFFVSLASSVLRTKAHDLRNNAEVVEHHRIRRTVGSHIEVSGRITFKDKAPRVIPPRSQLKLKLIDIIRADAPHIELASTLVDLSSYKNDTPLFYNITSKKPEVLHHMHSITAVLNIGWIPKGGENDDWIRNGDYHTTHSFLVNVTSRKDKFVRDIEMEIFKSSHSEVINGNETGLKTILLLLVALFFLD